MFRSSRCSSRREGARSRWIEDGFDGFESGIGERDRQSRGSDGTGIDERRPSGGIPSAFAKPPLTPIPKRGEAAAESPAGEDAAETPAGEDATESPEGDGSVRRSVRTSCSSGRACGDAVGGRGTLAAFLLLRRGARGDGSLAVPCCAARAFFVFGASLPLPEWRPEFLLFSFTRRSPRVAARRGGAARSRNRGAPRVWCRPGRSPFPAWRDRRPPRKGTGDSRAALPALRRPG